MNIFNANVTDSSSIMVESDFYWNCKAEGNFRLSKYSGKGNDTIKIIIPDDIMIADGVVHFSFGHDNCERFDLNVNMNNKNCIITFPNYTLCDGEKTIGFHYNYPNELFNARISCFNGWHIASANLSYIVNDNEITILSSKNDGTIVIEQNSEEIDKNKVFINLIGDDIPVDTR